MGKSACRRSMFSTTETVRAPGVPEFLPGRAENVFRGHCCREEKLRAMTSSSVYLCNLQRMRQAQKQTAEIGYPAFVRCLLVCNFDIPPQSTSPPLCPSLVSSSAPTSLGAHSPGSVRQHFQYPNPPSPLGQSRFPTKTATPRWECISASPCSIPHSASLPCAQSAVRGLVNTNASLSTSVVVHTMWSGLRLGC